MTADELEALFDHLDTRRSGLVDRSLLIHFIHPASHALATLEGKVRAKLRTSKARGASATAAFEARSGGAGGGRLPRTEFKAVLREGLGFELVDEPSALSLPAMAAPPPWLLRN